MRNILQSLPIALLVLLWVYAAASKLADIETFRHQLGRQPFPPGVAGALLYALPAAELLTAGLLIFPRSKAAGLQCSLALLTLFTGYIALSLLHFWQQVPCSCGGVISSLSWGQHLVFNCFFLCLNLVAIFLPIKERRSGD